MPPAQYEAMRDKFAKEMPLAAAKTKAAKIFNAKRKPGVAPVTGPEKGMGAIAPPRGG